MEGIHMHPIDVSVIIVSFNTRDLLRDCLSSIIKNTHGVSYEIIVVDNASKDGSADMVKEEFPNVHLIASDENNGFAKGNNIALPQVKGKHIFYLNPDTVLLNDAISQLSNFVDTHPDLGFVGPRLYRNTQRMHHPTIRFFTTPSSILFRHTPGYQYWQLFFERFLVDKTSTRVVDWLMGAALMGPADLIKENGGFDEIFFVYSEEEDLCRRLKQKGRNTYYYPEAEIVHFWGGSSSQTPSVANKFFWDSQMIYLLRYHSNATVKWFVNVFGLILTAKFWFGSKKRRPYLVQIKEIIQFHKP